MTLATASKTNTLVLNMSIMKNVSSDQIGDDHKQVKVGETTNTSEQLDTFLKMSTADHHGRFTDI